MTRQLYEFNSSNISNLKNYTDITYLGVQAKPGTHIYINNGNSSLVVGNLGVLQINIDELSPPFDSISMNAYSQDSLVPLLVHIIGKRREE